MGPSRVKSRVTRAANSSTKTKAARRPRRKKERVPIAPHAYSVPQTAEALGLSIWTVYHLLKLGKIGFVRVGSRRLIPVAEVDDFIRKNVVRRRAS